MKDIEEVKTENLAETKHDILFLLKQRYSPRIFKDKPIQNKHLQKADTFDLQRGIHLLQFLPAWD